MGLLEDKRRARLFYRYLSRIYDRINPFIWTADMRSEAVELADIDTDDRVLDVGCGTGYATEALLAEAEDVHGLDQSAHQLDQAFAKFGRRGPVRFYRGDAERLPFRDDSFDVVWSSGSIEYWPDPVATLAEFRRVVRPGGTVLVVGPNAPSSRVLKWIADAIMLFYDEATADRMFRAAGYTNPEHRLMGPAYNPAIAIATVAHFPEGGDGGEDD
ncbi:MAG: methyltransferase domain-containing protein [Halobacteriales archaeon]|nr:methyltransferase domain-containing protein [Halobacteriales archaeon]